MADLWYLSPSSQYANVGIGDYGTEAGQMNLMMDEIVKHLDRHGVDFYRADKKASIEEKCAESDDLGADWYFALHSNAGGKGQAWGPVAFHGGLAKDFAEDLVKELLATGQKNNRASNVQNGIRFYEINKPKAKCCLLEVDFHDSQAGTEFIMEHRAEAAKAIAKAIVRADGKKWSEPEKTSDHTDSDGKNYRDLVLELKLMNDGNWSDPVSREELAKALIRLRELMER